MLVGRRAGIDISKEGSGNVGATNVARVMGKKAGIITLLIDAVKGAFAPALVYYLIEPELATVAAVAVIAGHCFSIPGYLKGGKGVATSLGSVLFVAPLAGLAGMLVFLTVFLIWKIVSLASVAAVLVAPITTLFLESSGPAFYALAIIGLIVTFRHRTNLERLARGEEKKFEAKKA